MVCTYPCQPSYFQECVPRGPVFAEKSRATVAGMLEISYPRVATSPSQQTKMSIERLISPT